MVQETSGLTDILQNLSYSLPVHGLFLVTRSCFSLSGKDKVPSHAASLNIIIVTLPGLGRTLVMELHRGHSGSSPGPGGMVARN